MTLSPIPDSDWPDGLDHLRDGFAGKLNVYRVMAHNPALLAAWETLRNHVVLDNSLGDEHSEIVILRVGHRLVSEYEWQHHVVRAASRGVSAERIEAVRSGGAAMTADDRLLVEAVDQLTDTGRLAAETRAALGARFGWQAVLDLMATVGMYSTLAFIVNSFETPIDLSIDPPA